jgi:SAM-dependent methyltransferase
MIEAYAAEHSIRRVVDLGCGDFTVGSRIAALGVEYVGVDVVPALIRHHMERYATPKVRFVHLDIVADALPSGDLCLIRQVLQHLSNDQILHILPKLAQYEHVLITEHYPGHGTHVVPNKDKPQGHDTRIEDDSAVYLEHAPFGMRIGGVLLEHETTPLKCSGEVLRTMRVITRDR